jgi:hypothetical protein
MSRCKSAAESPGKPTRKPRRERLQQSPREPSPGRFPPWFAECRFERVLERLTQNISAT